MIAVYYQKNKTMKKLLLFLILFSCYCLQGQNLVSNCSFEDTASCPTNPGQVDRASGWSSFGASPDYYNACSTSGWLSVPNNFYGYQLASSGNAYVGLVTWGKDDSLYINSREFIGRALLTPLIIGEKYYISFKANFTLNNFETGYASNKLGIRFSTVQYNVLNPPQVNNFAHIYSDSIITDTLNWTTISSWFTADSAYTYICIGNFFKNGVTDSIVFDSTLFASYYFIDDVCVSLDSTKCTCDTSNGINDFFSEKFISIYPNPASDKIFVQNNFNDYTSIKIYNLFGKLFFNSQIKAEIESINLTPFKNGIYIISIQSEKKIFNQKISIIH